VSFEVTFKGVNCDGKTLIAVGMWLITVDYVTHHITARHGLFPPNFKKNNKNKFSATQQITTTCATVLLLTLLE